MADQNSGENIEQAVEVSLSGFERTPQETLNNLVYAEFPDANIGGAVFFSEQHPAYIDVIVPLLDVAKYIAVPITIHALIKLIERGKSINEGLDGWHGVFEKAFPGRARRLELMRAEAERLEETRVHFKIGARFRARSSPHWPTAWIANAVAPDDCAVLLALISPSLVVAIESLDRKGAEFAHGLSVDVQAETFSITWHDRNHRNDLLATFDLAGKPVGDWIELIPTEADIETLKSQFLAVWNQGREHSD